MVMKRLPRNDRDALAIAASLFGLAASLVAVGIISSTPIRHLIQIVPVVIIFGFALRSRSMGAYAALAVFAFWIGIMTLIWLYLLGLSDIAQGTYRTTEITLTFVIAGCSTFGATHSIRAARSARRTRRSVAFVLAFVLAFALQYAFLMVSFLSPFANR